MLTLVVLLDVVDNTILVSILKTALFLVDQLKLKHLRVSLLKDDKEPVPYLERCNCLLLLEETLALVKVALFVSSCRD